MLQAFMNVFTTLGDTVVVPVIIFIVALFLRVKPKTAMMSSLLVGVGLTGFGWIINAFTPVVTKIINQMIKNTGINLPVVDTGWQTSALASFHSSVGISFFIIGLILEVILFLIGYTKVFFPTNLWQNWGFMIWGAIAYTVTGNFWLSLGLSIFMMLYILVVAEIQADRYSDYFKISNGTTSALHNMENAVPAILLDPLWNLIGLNKLHLTPDVLKKKLGVFGEPTFIGAVLGIIIGFLGNFKHLGSLAAWGQILTFGVQLAAVMTIFPLVAHLFGNAFKPLTDEITERYSREKTQTTSEDDALHSKKRWFLAVDDGVGYGESATIISGVILIPIVVILAFLLPGNKTIPVVDLVSIPFMVESMVAIFRGNIAKIICTGTVWLGIGLYASSYMAPMYTEAVSHYGVAAATGAAMIVSFNVLARPLNVVIFAAWTSGNPFWIGLTIAVYAVLQYLLRTRRPQIWAYLKRMSEKNVSDDQPAKTNPTPAPSLAHQVQQS
ncbi:PTS galactitol transporter subunit IIC [Lactobacillus sp. PFC-70]|uniref:PTS transporter subunit IIC n=1 Tax=Levilactobacillus namurensis TaxID=380393 RepID=A0AAW8W350_9LACO|nr:PTS transporter subunit IIC [Levilactobacillus namurensis]MDT7013245.1 PTS transporter subunit IIC [Levilactobacillus namurensis]PTM23119.1 PTS galactitol transporter subunit IIC [Lactobacillus sp. PFC-70]